MNTQANLEAISPALSAIVSKAPSSDGVFGKTNDLPGMLKNIGGDRDTNEAITKRVLFLLEGEWIAGEALAQKLRNDLIDCYVRPNITSHQIALFLLNDIIRYYRTICVDFEFKTMQSLKPKPWGTRNVKLVFSRKLLYFSGVIAIAETAQKTYGQKKKSLLELFAMPVADRLLSVCGERAVRPLRIYEEFLEEMSKAEVREQLDNVTEANRDKSQTFRILKDRGHHFSWELLSLLKQTYESSHPIHRALVL